MDEEVKKVLVVEDDQFLLDAYKAKFKRERGLQIETARDGAEALEKVASFKPDIIILDIIMPNEDGFKVLSELQKQQSTVPIIVASNIDDEDQQDRARALGARDYFIKSNISMLELVAKIRATLG